MRNPIYKEFGHRLAQLRKTSNMTQSDVAKKLNTVQSTYSAYELGTRKVTAELIVSLSTLFNVSPDYLINGETKSSSKQEDIKNIVYNTKKTPPSEDESVSEEAMQIAKAYDDATLKDKNTVRVALGFPLIKEEQSSTGRMA